MGTAEKIDVLDPVDAIVFYGIDGRCYQTQGCSILGLLEFRRWHKVFVAEVGKISQMFKSEPLFENSTFMDFYDLSLEWEDPQVFEDVFPHWAEQAENEAEVEGVPAQDIPHYVEIRLGDYTNEAIETFRKFNFTGPTLSVACNKLLTLNGIEPSILPRQTFYNLLFDHLDRNGLPRSGRLIALNKPEPVKKRRSPPTNKPPSEVDPTYQAIAGLVSITEDLEKALAIAENYPAKVIDGIATAIAEQRDNTPGYNGDMAPRRLSPDELKDVLSTFSAPIRG